MVEESPVTDLELIELYFAGETDDAQSAAARALLASRPEFGCRLEKFKARLLEGAPVSMPAQTSWEQFRLRAGVLPRPTEHTIPASRRLRWAGNREARNPPRSPVYRAAVTAAVAAIVLVAWWGGTRVAGTHATTRTLVYTTHNGQRADVTLPDGSTASLNVASRLTVPENFGTGTRTVTLVGEALFTVSHREASAFTVVAGRTTTRVLGTTFAVRHYATDRSTRVVVRDGKVAVGTRVVVARQEAEVTRDGAVRIRPADPAEFAFSTGTLTLGWLPLRDAVVELERWYDVKIVLVDPALAARPVKASFAAGSASDLASILSLMLHARVERAGRELTIYPE